MVDHRPNHVHFDRKYENPCLKVKKTTDFKFSFITNWLIIGLFMSIFDRKYENPCLKVKKKKKKKKERKKERKEKNRKEKPLQKSSFLGSETSFSYTI